MTECVYVLAYASIMLNTDAHNAGVKNKMTLREFITNVQHNDGGELINKELLEDLYPRIVEEEIKMEDEGALFPTATKKGWLNLKSNGRFRVWKRRWVVLTTDKVHILKSIGHEWPVQSISLEGLLINTPVHEKSKYVLHLYHGPSDPCPKSRYPRERADGERRFHLCESVVLSNKAGITPYIESPKRTEPSPNDRLDLKERTVTLLSAPEKAVFDSWLTCINRNICICSNRHRFKHDQSTTTTLS